MREKLRRVNWYAVAALLFTLAAYVVVLDGGVPNAFALPVAATAVVAAVLSLRWP